MGYFMIKSKTSNRVLDVETDSREDGTEVVLWPCRETSRVLSMRDRATDNQVFFIDTEGALCSKASGHAIDVEEGKLVLRHRRPVTLPFPNTYSHPLPIFEYKSSDGSIAVRFPVASSAPGGEEFQLAALPSSKPRTLMDNVADTLTSAASTVFFAPLSLTGLTSPGPSQTSHATVDEIEGADFSLREHELADEDIVNDESTDDNPEKLRRIRVLRRQRTILNPHAQERQQWEIISILREKVSTGSFRRG